MKKNDGKYEIESTENLKEIADVVKKKTDAIIENGKSKECASNGTPMKELHGAAHITAELKNIGIEAKSDGA